MPVVKNNVKMCILHAYLFHLQPSLFQVLQDFGPGPVEDGDACPFWGKPGGDGPHAGEGGW